MCGFQFSLSQLLCTADLIKISGLFINHSLDALQLFVILISNSPWPALMPLISPFRSFWRATSSSWQAPSWPFRQTHMTSLSPFLILFGLHIFSLLSLFWKIERSPTRSPFWLCASTGNINPWLGKHVPAPTIFSMRSMSYHILNMYWKGNRWLVLPRTPCWVILKPPKPPAMLNPSLVWFWH